VRRKTITSGLNTPEQAAQAAQGFRLCEKAIVSQALVDSVRHAAARRPKRAAGQLARAAVHLGGYLRGCPGPWHR
jgi:hypothetical protein